MATDEPTLVVEAVIETVAVDPPAEGNAGKKAKKAASAPKPRNPSTHPPYEEMVRDAIVSLKERSGSSQYAIQKFLEEKHKQLPVNFRKLLLFHLKKLVAAGKIVKVKSSFKLPPAKTSAPKTITMTAKSVAKPKTVSKPKSGAKAKTVAKPKTVAKAKTVAKPKTAARVKTVAKPKATSPKPKQKERPAKAARTSSITSPGKNAAKPRAAPKKATARKVAVKPKSVKSPAKRVKK